MKNYAKWLLFLFGVLFFSQLFAQHGRYGRRYNDRYLYTYRPYAYAPLRTSVSVVARLPFGAVALNFDGRRYHYYEGIYYEPRPRGYLIVAPPVGVVVPVLPPSAVSIFIGGHPYYRYNDVYYSPLDNSRYQVIAKPRDEEQAQVAKPIAGNSNEGYEKFVLEGKTYYKKESKYYKAKLTDSGEILYEEVGEVSN